MSQDIKKDKSNIGRIMGIDFGSKRVGVSISDPTLTIAQGLTVLKNNHEVFDKIMKLCSEYNVGAIVVGLPLGLNGRYSKKTNEVIKFISELKTRLDIEIIKWDERFTTKIAQKAKLEMNLKKGKRREKSFDDIIASSLILQSYLDFLENKRRMAQGNEV